MASAVPKCEVATDGTLEAGALGRGGASPRAPEGKTGGAAPGERLTCALRDQGTLNLRREPEREGDDLADDVVPKAIAIFYRPHADAVSEAVVEHIKNHEE